MKVISIFNEKGGVAKTTTTANIGGALAQSGKKVLIIDGDQQGNLSSLLGFKQETENTLFDVLLDPKFNIENALRETKYENLYLLPNYKRDEDLAFLIQSNIKVNPHSRLQRQLRKIEEYFDYCIIDCAPGANIITSNILKASDELLAPVQLEEFAMEAVESLADTLIHAREEYNEDLIIRGVFATRVNLSYSDHKTLLTELKNVFGDAYLPLFIRTDEQVNKGTRAKMPIVYFNKKSKAAQDYTKLTMEAILKNESI